MDKRTEERIRENLKLIERNIWCRPDSEKLCPDCAKNVRGDLSGIKATAEEIEAILILKKKEG